MMNNKNNVKIGNYLQDYGFSMVSNLIIDYQQELDISDDELLFIIKISRYSNGWNIHDERLSDLSTKTLQRRRNSLRDKDLLDFSVVKERLADGKIITKGVRYDLTKLNDRLTRLYIEKQEEINERREARNNSSFFSTSERSKMTHGETKVSQDSTKNDRSYNNTIEPKTTITEEKYFELSDEDFENKFGVDLSGMDDADASSQKPSVSILREEIKKDIKKKFISEFKKTCQRIKEDTCAQYNIDIQWYRNETYTFSKKDSMNLNKMTLSDLVEFRKHLEVFSEYFFQEVDSNKFRTNESELLPTFSLFATSRIQRDKLATFYQDNK